MDGTLTPRSGPRRRQLQSRVYRGLIPALFVHSGLNTKLTLVFDWLIVAVAAIVLVVSFAAKFGRTGVEPRVSA